MGTPRRRGGPTAAEPDDRAPTRVRDTTWVRADGPDPGVLDPDRVGKWMLFPAWTHHDQAWALIRDATRAGTLGVRATASTAMPSPAPHAQDEGAIVISTRDAADVADVTRVLHALRDLGVRRRLVYLAGVQPMAGVGDGQAGLYVSQPDTRELEDHRDRVVLPGITPMAVVDVETTGLEGCPADRVVEIAIHRLDGTGALQDTFATLVNPGIPIPPAATGMHGITDRMVTDAPPFAAIGGEVARLLGGAVLVAHYAVFDYSFLFGEFRLLGRKLPRLLTICTQQLTRRVLPDQPSYRLEECCQALEVAEAPDHTALADAAATAALLRRLLPAAATATVSPLAEELPATARLLPDGWGAPWPPASAPRHARRLTPHAELL